MKKGLFITFEGPEGGGKSTQARLLVDVLRRGRRPVVYTREPGGTPLSEKIRHLVLHPDHPVHPMTELFLYEAARAQHVSQLIQPALRAGKIVVCERFADATEAYQAFGRGLPAATVRALNAWAMQGVKPDLTLLLDAPAADGLSRARGIAKKLSRGRRARAGGDRLERESVAFHEKVRRGYLTMARREPRRFRVIKWGAAAADVHQAIVSAVLQKLKGRG
jgi:dTMP kinase